MANPSSEAGKEPSAAEQADGAGATGAQATNPAPDAAPNTASGEATTSSASGLDSREALEKLAQWRRNAARSGPERVQQLLRDSRRRTALIQVFGAAPYLGEVCLVYPNAVFQALTDGPAAVISEAARDLSALKRASGGADALYESLRPLKQRCDLAIGLGELSGEWGLAEAAAARTDVAERMAEAALRWLSRAAYRRGEAQAGTDSDGEGDSTLGIFVLAGRRFAHGEISYFGPIDILVLYDAETLRSAGVNAPERTFMRIGAELRQALEGPPGERALYAATAPAVTGLAGAPLVCSVTDAAQAMAQETAEPLRAWFATSRVVAGDRHAGGAFLESLSERLWEGATTAQAIRAGADDKGFAHDPDAAFERLAQISRLALGRRRPVFRAASTRTVFETMGEVGALDPAQTERLAVASDFSQLARGRSQLITGQSGLASDPESHAAGLAHLCGFPDADGFSAVLAGARAEAANALTAVEGEGSIFSGDGGEPFDLGAETPYDVSKLEDLGFRDGAAITGLIDQWIGAHAGETETPPRFSELAPGLLTAFGETQKPEKAAAHFDALLTNAPEGADVFASLRKRPDLSEALVDFVGVFDGWAAPMTASDDAVAELLAPLGDEAPEAAGEWTRRFAPAWAGSAAAPSLEDISAWARRNIARAGFYLAAGAAPFDSASQIVGAIIETALKAVFERCREDASGAERRAADAMCLMGAGDLGNGHLTPGDPARVFFLYDDGREGVAEKDVVDAAEAFVRRFTDAVAHVDAGAGLLDVDMRHRPGGVSSALVPSLSAMRDYYQSGAVATEQIMLTGMRPLAGAEAVCARVAQTLFDLVTRPRKADLILRDADRARARVSRTDQATPLWDVRRISGGLGDVELIIGALKVKHGAAHAYVLEADPAKALDAMARAGLIDPSHAEELAQTRAFWLRIEAAQGFARWRDPDADPISPRLAAVLARAAGIDQFAHVEPLMRGHAERVNVLYNHLVLGRERPMAPALRVVS